MFSTISTIVPKTADQIPKENQIKYASCHAFKTKILCSIRAKIQQFDN